MRDWGAEDPAGTGQVLMDNPSPSIRAWAQRLLTMETANKPTSDVSAHEVLHVFEKLRMALTQFVGADGFTAMLRRALALARSDFPSLQAAKVTPDGRLEGIEDLIGTKSDFEAATAITAHLLGLLVNFVGEPLTLRLMRNVWPDEFNPIPIESEDL